MERGSPDITPEKPRSQSGARAQRQRVRIKIDARPNTRDQVKNPGCVRSQAEFR
uniref:Uncharacterized protein n=1 Tax=Ralstonia solanacearum TaxID=305 RepID=A0A0S4TNI9_RALSL|nr:protein of unknown function [Ralstonia solanacearum]